LQDTQALKNVLQLEMKRNDLLDA